MEYVGGGDGVVRYLSDWDSSSRAWRLATAAVRCARERDRLRFREDGREGNVPGLPRF